MATQLTTNQGAPIADALNSMTVGPRGPLMLADSQMIEEMTKFNREKIQERMVHAKGVGAYGYFVVTNDMSKYTKADLFNGVGKTCQLVVRFSTTTGESGSADTVRDIRGMGIKLYTAEGNCDLVCINLPVFFICEPRKFPHLHHATGRHPVTHLHDNNTFWDFMTLTPESAHAVMHLYADNGLPDGFRHLEAYGCHVFKFVNAEGAYTYCKFQITPVNGERFLTDERAKELAGCNPDYAIQDLYDSIKKGDFPKWYLQVQLMTQEQADNLPFNPFCITEELPEETFPLMTIGEIILNKNPENYFSEVEQVALCPSNLVPGIERPEDRAFDGRSFAYGDAQRARLTGNFADLKVNRPITKVNNYQQNGLMSCHYQVGPTNYYPNTTGGPQPNPIYKETVYKVCGDVDRYPCCNDNHYVQAGEFYLSLEDDEKDRIIQRLAKDAPTDPTIKHNFIEYCTKIDGELGARVAEMIA